MPHSLFLPLYWVSVKNDKSVYQTKNADFNHFDPNLGMFALTLSDTVCIFSDFVEWISLERKKKARHKCVPLYFVSSLIDHFLFEALSGNVLDRCQRLSQCGNLLYRPMLSPI